MIKYLIDYVLLNLHIRKPSGRSAFQQIMDLIPLMWGVGLIIAALNHLTREGLLEVRPLSWHRKFFNSVRWSFKRFRLVVVGY